MHSGIVTKCFDKNIRTVLCQLFHQSHRLKNINSATKRQSPFFTLKSNFTYILDSILEKQIFCNISIELKQSLSRNAVGHTNAVKTIVEIFNVPLKDAKVIVKRNHAFNYITKRAMIDNCEKLKIAGMSLPVIRDNIDLLSEDSDILQKKIVYMKKFVNNIDHAVPLLYHNARNLGQFVDSQPGISYDIIKFYGQQWKIQNDEVYSLISKYMYHMTYHPKNTVEIIKLLLDKKVTVSSLLSKNWNLLIKREVAERRFETCSKLGYMLPMRPWVLNCKDSEFARRTSTQNNKSNILDYDNVVDFLSEKSGYRTILIDSRLSIYNLQCKTLKETKLITDLIIKEGYDWHDLVWSIEVLNLSEKLIIDRFSQLKNINHRPHFLNFLLFSDQDFVKYVNTCKN